MPTFGPSCTPNLQVPVGMRHFTGILDEFVTAGRLVYLRPLPGHMVYSHYAWNKSFYLFLTLSNALSNIHEGLTIVYLRHFHIKLQDSVIDFELIALSETWAHQSLCPRESDIMNKSCHCFLCIHQEARIWQWPIIGSLRHRTAGKNVVRDQEPMSGSMQLPY